MNGTGQHFPEPNMRFPEPADRQRADDDVEAQTSEEDLDMDYHEDHMADVNVEGGMTVAFKVRPPGSSPASNSCQLHSWRGNASPQCAANATRIINALGEKTSASPRMCLMRPEYLFVIVAACSHCNLQPSGRAQLPASYT